MEIIAAAYTRQGGELCAHLIEELSERGHACKGYLFARYENSRLLPFDDLEPIIGGAFEKRQALILICAMGIAVRKISGFIKSKTTDSPVVVVDETGHFCIPVLSGHLGGANALGRLCAEITGGVPVITTATDLHGRFAPDMFAKSNGLVIADMAAAKRIAADLPEQKRIYMYAEGVSFANRPSDESVIITDDIERARAGGIIISARTVESCGALWLIPRQVTLGIGCRRGTPKEQIASAAAYVLTENGLSFAAVKQICSIDLKKDEKGLVEFAAENGLIFRTFDSAALAAVEGDFCGSEFVRGATGVDNVCERSAVAGSGGALIVRKTVREHVTVAAALSEAELYFD